MEFITILVMVMRELPSLQQIRFRAVGTTSASHPRKGMHAPYGAPSTDGGDGNLTEMTQYVDDTTTRITDMTYDFRNRRVTTDGEVDYFKKSYYDNLDRVTKSERYDTSEEGNLIARSETLFDDRGRVYQSIRYAVDPDTGDVGNSLTDNTWFDDVGNVIKSLPSGSNLFTKTEYDSLNRPQTRYTGYDLDETGYPG